MPDQLLGRGNNCIFQFITVEHSLISGWYCACCTAHCACCTAHCACCTFRCLFSAASALTMKLYVSQARGLQDVSAIDTRYAHTAESSLRAQLAHPPP